MTVTTRLLGPPEHRGSDDMLYRLLSDVDREVSARRPRRVAARAAATLPWVALALLLALAAVLTRVEAFNLLNTVQPLDPSFNFAAANFGRVVNTRDPRVFQFAVKYVF